MVYSFRSGARIPAGTPSPEKVVELLDDIKSRYAALTAKTLTDDVEADELHPLRPWFTWDAELGMRKLHELEAGNVIRAVVVEKVSPVQEFPVRAFFLSKDREGETAYEHVQAVITNRSKRTLLIAQLMREKKQVDDKFLEIMALIGLVPD